MRTLSFENLRRLVGRRKDRDEPSFERSESFKRISIRKSYLDRAKRRTRLQNKSNEVTCNGTIMDNEPLLIPSTTVNNNVVTVEVSSRPRILKNNVIGPTVIQVRGNSHYSEEFDIDEKNDRKINREDVGVIKIVGIIEERGENENNNDANHNYYDENEEDEEEEKLRREESSGTIVYGQWINDVDSTYSSCSKDRKSRLDSYSSHDSIQYYNNNKNLDSSQDKKRSFVLGNDSKKQNRDKSNDCVVLVNNNNNSRDRGVTSVLIELEKSPPRLPKSQVKSQNKTNWNQTTSDCTCGAITTVNLHSSSTADDDLLNSWSGHHHHQVPSVSNGTSLVSVNSSTNDQRNCNVVNNVKSRLIPVVVKVPSPMIKTNNATNRNTGFSLSLSISRLTTDLRAAAVTTKNELFRRRKNRPTTVKPSPSVSTEGYFERTAAAAVAVTTASSRRSKRSAIGSGRRRPVAYASRRRGTKVTTSSNVNNNKISCQVSPPCSPVWFVPPERRSTNHRKGRVWREVRYLDKSDNDLNVDEKSMNNNAAESINNWSNNDSNLSDEFDDKKLLQSGDFDNKSETELINQKKQDSASTVDSSSLLSSSITSSGTTVSQKKSKKISDFNEDKIFYEEYQGDYYKSSSASSIKAAIGGCKPLVGSNYFSSSQFLGFVAKGVNNGKNKQRFESSSSSDCEQDERRVLLVVNGTKKDDTNDAIVDNFNRNSVSGNKSCGSGGGGVEPKKKKNCSVVLVLEGQKSSVAANRNKQEIGPGQKRRPLRRKSQVMRRTGPHGNNGTAAGGNNVSRQPVYLARRRSSLRRRPCSKNFFLFSNRMTTLV